MSYDAHANLAYATVAVAPSPAASGTSLTVGAGKGSLFPTAPFNCSVYPSGTPPLASNAEIVRVTNVVGDVFTIVRAQEGTTAKNIATGWQIANTATKLVFTDIENSIIQFISAGTTKASASEVIFANANGVTFGADGQSITASVAAAAQSTQPVAASASNGSFLFSTLGFSNANGVTFGTSGGSIITASVNTAAGVGGVAISGGTSSQSTGTVVFSNSNGVTFGLDNGTLTASVNTAGGGGVAISAGTQSTGGGTVSFADSNNMIFGLSNGTLTAQAIVASFIPGFSADGGSSTYAAVLTFINGNGISFYNSARSVAGSHNGLTSQSNQAASASNGSFTFQTLNFSNANGVTFGTSAGGIVTASINAGAGGSINFSAGTQSADLASIVFSNSNGVTFGLSNGTITASASGGAAAGQTMSFLQFPEGLYGTIGSLAENSASIVFMQVPFNLSFTRIEYPINITVQTAGNNSTRAINFSNTVVIYTRNGNTLSSLASTTQTTAATWTSNDAARFIGVNMMPLFLASSLTPGPYWVGILNKTAATGGALTGAATQSATNVCLMWGVPSAVFSGNGANEFGMASASSFGVTQGNGLYSSTGNMTEIAMSNLTCVGSSFQRAALILRLTA